MIIETYPNERDGIEARIAFRKDGFAVTLYDTDAEQTVPVIRVFGCLESARAYAHKLAN